MNKKTIINLAAIVTLSLVLIMTFGCTKKKQLGIDISDQPEVMKDACFTAGGSEFQYGMSGDASHSHRVCVFKK